MLTSDVKLSIAWMYVFDIVWVYFVELAPCTTVSDYPRAQNMRSDEECLCVMCVCGVRGHKQIRFVAHRYPNEIHMPHRKHFVYPRHMSCAAVGAAIGMYTHQIRSFSENLNSSLSKLNNEKISKRLLCWFWCFWCFYGRIRCVAFVR